MIGYVRPRNWRQASDDILVEFFCREVAIFEESARFNLNVPNGAKFLHESTERM